MLNKNIKTVLLLIYLFPSISFSQNNDYIIKFKSSKVIDKLQTQSNNLFQPLFSDDMRKKFNRLQSNANFNLQLFYKVNKDKLNLQVIADLQKSNEIEFIEENHIYRIEKATFPNDSFYNYQWALKAINADKVWGKASGEGILIGLIDTGIDYLHEDLKNQLWVNIPEDINKTGKFEPWSNKISREGVFGDFDDIDNDMNGFTDDVIGFDFVDQTYAKFGDWSERDPIPEDEGNHGTGVAGVIAAEGHNLIGITGVAPKCRILTSKVFDITGNAETDDIAAGILYAALNGAKIINMSFGDPFESKLLRDVINYVNSLGCVLVASSGNENNNKPHFPSDFDCVISVGGSNQKNLRSQISNFGVNLSILAPGEDILTCEPGNEYRRFSGTSFSAPYVSGACALLLQLNPKLTSSQIRSTIEAEATRISSQGWDKFAGAGILNLETLLNTNSFSEFEINNLKNYLFLEKGILNDKFDLSIKTPLFDSWQLEYQLINSKNYIPLSELNSNQNIGEISVPLSSTQFGNDFQLSLKINLKNGHFLRRNKYISVNNDSIKLKVDYFNVLSAIQNGKRVYVVSARTNKPAAAYVSYFPQSSPSLISRKDEIEKYSKNHMLILDEFPTQGNYSGKIIFNLTSQAGNLIDTLSREFVLTYEPLVFPTVNYIEKTYKLPRGYLYNTVKDIYKNGKNSVILNNLEDLYIGNTEIYEFNNNNFVQKDTSAEGWIPIDFGDSRGNGVKSDLLSTQNAKAVISTSNAQSHSPYSELLFQSPIGKTFWAEGFYDFDKDGIDEILAYNDTTYFTYKFQYGKYLPFKILELDSTNIRGVIKGSAVGDFDGDGNIEVVHSNYYGNIFIFEFVNGKFELEWEDTFDYGNSNPIINTIKLSDSPLPAVIIGTNGSQLLFGENDDYESIWNYRILTSQGKNSYSTRIFENILGVRAGIEPRTKLSYRNGITKGDIDNDNADELIISAFPNTYVLKFENKKFNPVWQYKYSLTNTAIVNDFDGNGKKEIGIATYDSTRFFEINIKNDKLKNPIIKEAFSTKNNSAIIKWYTVPNSEKYKLYSLKPDINGSYKIEFIKDVIGDSAYVSGLEPYNYHYFLLSSFNSTLQNSESDFSELIEVHTHDDSIYPKSVNVVNSNTLNVTYSGKIKSILHRVIYFELSDEKMGIQYPTSVQAINDTVYLLSFSRIIENGQYQLLCRSFPDFWNSPTIEKSISFSMNIPESSAELFLKALEVKDMNNLVLSFSENIIGGSDTKLENYSLQPYGKILSIQKLNSNSVQIILDDEIKLRNLTGDKFVISCKEVISEDGDKITKGPGSSLAFVFTKENLETAFTFPNPFSLSKDEFLRIGNLTAEAEIEILDINGKILHSIIEKSADGGVAWDLKDKTGQKLKVGIYLLRINGINSNGQEVPSELHKFAIVP